MKGKEGKEEKMKELEKVAKGELAGVKKDVDKLKKDTPETKKEISDNKVEGEKKWKEELQKKEITIRKSFAQGG